MKIKIEYPEGDDVRILDQGDVSLIVRTAREELEVIPPGTRRSGDGGDGRWELPGLLRRLAYALEEEELKAIPRRRPDWPPPARIPADHVRLEQMCHELRTPINAVVGYVDLLREEIYGDLTPPQTEAVERIRQASEDLIVALQHLSRMADLDLGQLQVTASTPIWRRASQEKAGSE